MDKEIKEIIDKGLQHIYLTEDLKNKTLEKCKAINKVPKKFLICKKYFVGSVVLCGIIAMFTFGYFFYYYNFYGDKNNYAIKEKKEAKLVKPIGEITYNEFKNNQKTKKDSKQVNSDIIQKTTELSKGDENKIHDGKNKKYSLKKPKENNICLNKPDTKKDKKISNPENKLINSLKVDEKNKKIEKDRKGKLKLPSYLPMGYSLEYINVNKKEKEELVQIKYKNGEYYFNIEKINKETWESIKTKASFLKEYKINKNIDGDYYVLNGNISEEVLKKILDSIK